MNPKLQQRLSENFRKHSIVVSKVDYPLEKFPDGWGLQVEVPQSTDLGSEEISDLLNQIKDTFGFAILVCDSPWKPAAPVYEQIQKSRDLQIPHLEYIHIPTCVIHVPAGKPIRRSQTLLLPEEVFKDSLSDLAKEQGEEVVKYNGNWRLPYWIENHATLHDDSERFNEILMKKYSAGTYVHNWSPDHEKTQILILCNSDDQTGTTYHCRFEAAYDFPVSGIAIQNLFVKKLDYAIKVGDFVSN